MKSLYLEYLVVRIILTHLFFINVNKTKWAVEKLTFYPLLFAEASEQQHSLIAIQSI
jgi:hypothetical protein